MRVPRPDGDRYYMTTVKPILDDQRRVISVICISKEITERKTMENRLAHMAQHDMLTNLPNRALFNDRLQHAITQAKRNKTRLALMFLDLDNFKPINDTFGHQVGDLLLQAAAKRVQDAYANRIPRDASAVMNSSFCCQPLKKIRMHWWLQKKSAIPLINPLICLVVKV